MFVIVICHMSKSVLTTRLSDKDYSVQNDRNQTNVTLMKQIKNASFDSSNIQGRIFTLRFVYPDTKVSKNFRVCTTQTCVRCFNKKKLIVSHRAIQHD